MFRVPTNKSVNETNSYWEPGFILSISLFMGSIHTRNAVLLKWSDFHSAWKLIDLVRKNNCLTGIKSHMMLSQRNKMKELFIDFNPCSLRLLLEF